MIRRAETLAMTVLLMAMYCSPARGQAPPATLKVELQNVIFYEVDTSDSANSEPIPTSRPPA
jgi:hypothetical protein